MTLPPLFHEIVRRLGPLGRVVGRAWWLLPLVLSACATQSSKAPTKTAPALPAETAFNPDAGRGNLLFVTLRSDWGADLTFFIDTGTSHTTIDKSLEPTLDKPVGEAWTSHWGDTEKVAAYAAPKLFLGGTPLLTGSRVFIGDFKQLSAQTGRPVAGILGMDCLCHYCLQLDFDADKIRFLDPAQADGTPLGTAYHLTFRHGCPFIHQGNLAGEQGTNLLIDAGFRNDGTLESDLYQQALSQPGPAGAPVGSQRADRWWFPQTTWTGGSYTNLLLGDGGTNFDRGQGGNSLGLRFLARHLVTFDFPHQVLYLKQTTSGPLVDRTMQAAQTFFRGLQEQGALPGWSAAEAGAIYLEAYPNYDAFDGRKDGDATVYHYQVARAADTGAWKLLKAWRSNEAGKTIEEFSVL